MGKPFSFSKAWASAPSRLADVNRSLLLVWYIVYVCCVVYCLIMLSGMLFVYVVWYIDYICCLACCLYMLSGILSNYVVWHAVCICCVVYCLYMLFGILSIYVGWYIDYTVIRIYVIIRYICIRRYV